MRRRLLNPSFSSLLQLILGRKTPSTRATEALERIWNEYPNGLLDLTEEKLLKLPPDAPGTAIGEQINNGKDAVTLEEGGTTLSYEDMENLRSEIFLQLK